MSHETAFATSEAIRLETWEAISREVDALPNPTCSCADCQAHYHGPRPCTCSECREEQARGEVYPDYGF